MTRPLDATLAHVRFVDHTERCVDCNPRPGREHSRIPGVVVEVVELCPRGTELLAEWQRAEELATKQAEERDAAALIELEDRATQDDLTQEAVADATGEPYTEDCADDAEFFKEAQRESFE